VDVESGVVLVLGLGLFLGQGAVSVHPEDLIFDTGHQPVQLVAVLGGLEFFNGREGLIPKTLAAAPPLAATWVVVVVAVDSSEERLLHAAAVNETAMMMVRSRRIFISASPV
jgi:hypothetical protein